MTTGLLPPWGPCRSATFPAMQTAGYSEKVVVGQQGLKASCSAGLGNNPRGRLRLQFAVVNNDRPVTIPLDDLAGGFNIEVGWKAADTAIND